MSGLFRFGIVLVTILPAVPSGVASAQDYPTRPIRFLVGPGPDTFARMIGQKLTEIWKQQIVVDQRPGAGGIVAAETTAKAAPDGYTLLLTTGVYTTNAALYKKLPYDLLHDLAPVSLLNRVQFLLVVNPSVPAKSVKELIQLARANPGKLNCASSGTGTTAHLGCEMFKSMANINIVHVPYKGLPAAITDVLGGQVEMLFAVIYSGLPYLASGKLKALAVSGEKRAPAAPDLPTVAEAGVPGFAFDSWNGVHVPARTPKAIIAKLNRELLECLKFRDVKERMAAFGMDAVGSTPEEFDAFVKADILRWVKVVKDANVQVE